MAPTTRKQAASAESLGKDIVLLNVTGETTRNRGQKRKNIGSGDSEPVRKKMAVPSTSTAMPTLKNLDTNKSDGSAKAIRGRKSASNKVTGDDSLINKLPNEVDC